MRLAFSLKKEGETIKIRESAVVKMWIVQYFIVIQFNFVIRTHEIGFHMKEKNRGCETKTYFFRNDYHAINGDKNKLNRRSVRKKATAIDYDCAKSVKITTNNHLLRWLYHQKTIFLGGCTKNCDENVNHTMMNFSMK